jgi:hypothetical protein
MSPVEIWGMLNFWQMNVACVPLPAPGAPNRISLMVMSLSFVIVLVGPAKRPDASVF